MKKVLLIVMLALAAGCEGKNQYGECIGVADEPNPALRYKTSARNAVLGIIFLETIFAPIVWLASDFRCPIGP